MQTLERVGKRNQDFLVGNNLESSMQERERFTVQLRKNTRKQFFSKQRWKDTKLRGLDKAENEKFKSDKKAYIDTISENVRKYINNENIVAQGLEKLIICFSSKSYVIDYWEGGVFSLCIFVIDRTNSLEILSKATDLLANLSLCDEKKAKVMVDEGLIPKSLKLLDIKHKEITKNILWCLGNLVITSHDITMLLAADPIFSYLLKLTTDIEILNNTRLLIILIYISKRTKEIEFHSNTLTPIFVNSLKNQETFIYGIMGLEYLTINNVANLKKIYYYCPEIIEKILALVGNEDKYLILHSLKLLGNFAFSDDYIQDLLDKGVLPFIKKVMIRSNAAHKKEVFFILSNLLLSEEHHLGVIMADKELVFRILEGVNEIDYEVRHEVWYCIKILTSKVPFYPLEFFDTLVFNMSLSFSKESDPKILILMLESYEFMLKKVGIHQETLRNLLDSSQCFEKMSEKIFHGNKDVSEKASGIIDEFYDKFEIRGSAPEQFEFAFS